MAIAGQSSIVLFKNSAIPSSEVENITLASREEPIFPVLLISSMALKAFSLISIIFVQRALSLSSSHSDFSLGKSEKKTLSEISESISFLITCHVSSAVNESMGAISRVKVNKISYKTV